MAYPDAYTRQYDFQSYQNLNPTRPLPADKVNADLNAVAAFASEVVSFLSTSIRDDGQIVNGAIGYDQLSAELQTNSIAPATPWATATVYAAGKSVLHTSSIYRCVTSHTSGDFASDLSAGYWTLVGTLPAIDTSNTFAWTGSHTFSLAVGFADGSAAVPSIGFTNDTNTGFYRIGGDNIGFTCGGSKVFDLSGTRALVPMSTASSSTSTGALVVTGGLGIGGALYGGTTLNIAGVATLASGTATPAGGSTAARLLFGTTAGFGIYYGSGAPTVSAASGSIYIRTDNAGANMRLYSNTTGSTTWAAITSA